MEIEDILRLYDTEYAASYDANFLLGPNFLECTDYETSCIEGFLRDSNSWLDVACGTGYFLSRFPSVTRGGLDISPAMLERARRVNPGVDIVEGDFRVPRDEWFGKWELVSCMWYAYSYAGSIHGVEKVLRNLIDWTAVGGTCFVPVCDPDVLCLTRIPHRPHAGGNDGRLEITAVVYNWIDEPSGRRHIGMVAPHIEHLVEFFQGSFDEVEVCRYPDFVADCMLSRHAIIAKGKMREVSKGG